MCGVIAIFTPQNKEIMENRGFVHLYTGNGKGKTTAALGLALRAVGAGHKVFIAQFVKGMRYAEIDAFDKYLNNSIVTQQYGLECFINRQPEQADIDAAKEGLIAVSEILGSGKYNLVILDEICIAIYFKLISIDDLIDVLNGRHPSVEVVLTGRYASPELIDYADLVTEMKEVKHYYNQGVLSRKGVEF